MKKINYLALIAISILCFGCSNNKEETVEETSTDSTITNVINNTISINENNNKTYSSFTEMVNDVKNSVVDVYGTLSNGTSCGSGVIVGEDNNDNYYIITNHHVIENCTSFSVTINDTNSTSMDATLLGTSPSKDIAVLKVSSSSSELSIATLGNSDNNQVGEEVVAIGNPLGILGGTVTKGIISSLEREMYLEGLGYMTLLQTDAAINNGNSGGALFNSNGALIGIVNSGYSDYEGLNFAIPINIAKTTFESIVETYTGSNFGYLRGENNLGIELSEFQIYSDQNLTSYKQEIAVYECLTGSDAKGSNVKDYASYYSGTYDTFYVIDKINNEEITSIEKGIKALQNAAVGSSISIQYQTVGFKRTGGFGNTVAYLNGDSSNLNISVTQYIYSI